MEYKKIKLQNNMYDAFCEIYQDVESLASLATDTDIFNKNGNEIQQIKNKVKQTIKAIEYLTTNAT